MRETTSGPWEYWPMKHWRVSRRFRRIQLRPLWRGFSTMSHRRWRRCPAFQICSPHLFYGCFGRNPPKGPRPRAGGSGARQGGGPARPFPVQQLPSVEGSGSMAGPLTSTPTGVQPKPAGLNSWFAELKRRRVVRALVAYGIASFAVLQIIEPIMHGAHWPEIVLSYVVAGL